MVFYFISSANISDHFHSLNSNRKLDKANLKRVKYFRIYRSTNYSYLKPAIKVESSVLFDFISSEIFIRLAAPDATEFAWIAT